MKRVNKAERKKIDAEKDRMKQICHKFHVKFIEFFAGQYRLIKGYKKIDYYPKSKKCFWHSDNEWGVVENIEMFIAFEYGKTQ